MRRLSWPWRLHSDLAQRRRHGDAVVAAAEQDVAQSAGRVEEMQKAARPLQDKATENNFVQLIQALNAGLDLHKSAG